MDKDVRQAKLHNALERAKDAVNFAWESGYREGMEAMRLYADHLPGCNIWHRTKPKCDCGLTELLEGARHE